MKQCKFCQAEMEEDFLFCPVCGKSQEEHPEAPAQEDPSAGQPLPEEASAVGEMPESPAREPVPGEAAPAAEASPAAKSVTPGKLAMAIAAVVVLIAVLVALVLAGLQDKESLSAAPTEAPTEASTEAVETVPATVPADGNPDDVTCKGTYTVTDAEVKANADTVVATMDGAQLTNSQLQVYYWMQVYNFLNSYGAYAPYFGLDYTQPLDTQIPMEEGYNTWQQFFLENALRNWQQIQAMAMEAQEAGLEISPEDQVYLDGLEQTLTQTAESNGMTLEELMIKNVGTGAGLPEFIRYQELYHQGLAFFEHQVEQMVPTEQELEDFYALHEEDYLSNNITKDALLVDVRHILITTEGGTTGEDGVTTYSQEEWAACEAKAQEVLDTWLAGDKTEERFAELANQHSQDGGSNTNGGLYENVYTGQMVEAFDSWCFDESRRPGDYGLVKTEYGYHVMYFVESRPMWRYYTESDWHNEQTSQMLQTLLEEHPMEVSYQSISLGLADLV